jgi:hypothetical protein
VINFLLPWCHGTRDGSCSFASDPSPILTEPTTTIVSKWKVTNDFFISTNCARQVLTNDPNRTVHLPLLTPATHVTLGAECKWGRQEMERSKSNPRESQRIYYSKLLIILKHKRKIYNNQSLLVSTKLGKLEMKFIGVEKTNTKKRWKRRGKRKSNRKSNRKREK